MKTRRPRAEYVIRLSKTVTMQFRLVPAGRFRMGARGGDPDEEPVHIVEIVKPFYMGTYPVRQVEYAVWKPEHENRFPNRPECPAESLSWDDAMGYCGWLTARYRSQLPAGHVVTLPTEAEWEYACRAGTETEYHTGDGPGELEAAGWFEKNSEDQTQAVGQKEPNEFGLYDMHGNVREWCWDPWEEGAYKRRVDGDPDRAAEARWAALQAGAPDETGENPGRVVRGGAWFGSAGWCRSACRNRWIPDVGDMDRGFRVCLVPGPADDPEAGVAPARDGARRDAGAESEDGAAPAATNLRRARFPRRKSPKR